MSQPTSSRRRARSVVITTLVAFAVLIAAACDPEKEKVSFAEINQVRGGDGVPALVQSNELVSKARAQADRMANAGKIFHSTDLAAGVSPGWTLVGENVAVAATIEEAQQALENSPAHVQNMVNPVFTEMGVGVTVKNGLVYVVQVFVGR